MLILVNTLWEYFPFSAEARAAGAAALPTAAEEEEGGGGETEAGGAYGPQGKGTG